MAMMSRWTSFVPPPKVRINVARYIRSRRPRNAASGEPRRRYPVCPITSSSNRYASTKNSLPNTFTVDAYRLLLEVVGQMGTVRRGSPEAVIRGRLERMYRATLILTFGGGTNEVQRDIIAMAGLAMPRSR